MKVMFKLAEVYIVLGLLIMGIMWAVGTTQYEAMIYLEAFKIECALTDKSYEIEIIKMYLQTVITWPYALMSGI